MNEQQKNGDTKHVLVVGDWVIDENTIIAGYDSDTSSHRGSRHFRSVINDPNAQVLGLCAAGNVARALHGLHSEEDKITPGVQVPDPYHFDDHTLNEAEDRNNIQVYGLGLWNRNDTKLLASLFSNDIITNETPLTLQGMAPTGKPEYSNRVSLCGTKVSHGTCQANAEGNNKSCKSAIGCRYLQPLYPADNTIKEITIRVTRQYNMAAGSDPVLKYRVDWEKSDPFSPSRDQIKSVLADLPPDWNQIEYIVVSDHHKGCMTDELAKCLCERYPKAKWYIRTKDLTVNWPNEIKSSNIILRFIGADYVPYRSATKRWFYGKEESREAIQELQNIGGIQAIKTSDDRWVISLHDDNSIIALHKKEGADSTEAYSLVSEFKKQSINVGRSSVVFATCVASLLGCYAKNNDPMLMLQRSAANGHNWSESYKRNFRKARTSNGEKHIHLHGDHAQAIKKSDEAKSQMAKAGNVTRKDTKAIVELWESAHKNCGIVSVQDREEFHLWRGFSSIDKYIAIRDRVRKELDILYQAVSDYMKGKWPNESLRCLIVGEPGFGKTYLIEQLAKCFDIKYRDFNLSQLTSLDQVIDCFDAISSLQNQEKDKKVLVFFDEIDTNIGTDNPIPLFLSPILDSTYRRGSHSFKLDPCIWVFAGAKDPADNKSSDFRSRINGPRLELSRTDEDKRNISKTEQVYWCVRMLLDSHFDISGISKSVLDVLYDLELVGGPRELGMLMKRFRNIQYGYIRARNLPVWEDIGSLLKYSNITQEKYEELLKIREDEDAVISIIEKPDLYVKPVS